MGSPRWAGRRLKSDEQAISVGSAALSRHIKALSVVRPRSLLCQSCIPPPSYRIPPIPGANCPATSHCVRNASPRAGGRPGSSSQCRHAGSHGARSEIAACVGPGWE